MADGKDNVFSKLDSAWNDVANGKGTVDGLSKAVNDVVSAVKNFADEYNYTVSYLKKNVGQGSGISNQLESLQRGIPNEKTLKAMGMSVDKNGNLQVDENKLREALVSSAGSYVDDEGKIQSGISFDKNGKMSIDANSALKADEKGNLSVDWNKQGRVPLSQGSDMVKELVGGQYGMADRVGGRQPLSWILQLTRFWEVMLLLMFPIQIRLIAPAPAIRLLMGHQKVLLRCLILSCSLRTLQRVAHLI